MLSFQKGFVFSIQKGRRLPIRNIRHKPQSKEFKNTVLPAVIKFTGELQWRNVIFLDIRYYNSLCLCCKKL